VSCQQEEENQDINIVPRPQSYILQKGAFTLDENTSLYFEGLNEEVNGILKNFRDKIIRATGFQLHHATAVPSKNAIVFQLMSNSELGEEGYLLNVSSKKVEIGAQTPAGLFYGMQSLLQLFPTEILSDRKVNNVDWKIPCIEIVDQPAFAYRGAHLDVARHFFDLDSIKRHIDNLARYKINHFHWHLTDDQGWRLEIKKHPKLTEIGSCRKETLIGSYANDVPHRYDGEEYCGFYTQEEAREVVRYAMERFITVIPEVELPGHALAALSAYPEMGCEPNKKYEAATTWGVFEDVFCPNETTFSIFEDVFIEVMDIFPSKYIHIGGDECPKKAWKESAFCQNLIKQHGLKDEHGLQSYFVQRIEKFINRHGRQIIGWDEILEGGLAENAIVMSWQGFEGGIESAKQGHDVIMAPTSYCYLDYYQADPQTEPLAIGGFVTLNKVYHLNPVPEEIPADKRHHILGPQGNLWTEYIKTFNQVEYMVFPRMLALSEVGWTKPENKNWGDFCRRLPYQLQALDVLGTNHGTISYNIQFQGIKDSEDNYLIELTSEISNAAIAFTTDGSDPTPQSEKYSTPIRIDKNTILKAAPAFNEKSVGKAQEKSITFHKAIGKKVVYEKPADTKYPGKGTLNLVDGMKGSKNFGDGFWQGFFGYDCNVTIDLEHPTEFSKIALTAIQSTTSWIMFPKYVTFYASNDGVQWQELGKSINDIDPMENGNLIKEFYVMLESPALYQYLKVDVTSLQTCPKGHAAEGSNCWLFVDEIVVE
jgi:hexosaminidase